MILQREEDKNIVDETKKIILTTINKVKKLQHRKKIKFKKLRPDHKSRKLTDEAETVANKEDKKQKKQR